jgi:hypothetical protein
MQFNCRRPALHLLIASTFDVARFEFKKNRRRVTALVLKTVSAVPAPAGCPTHFMLLRYKFPFVLRVIPSEARNLLFPRRFEKQIPRRYRSSG